MVSARTQLPTQQSPVTVAYRNARSIAAPEFVKWIYEFGDQASEVSRVQRYKDADYVTFRDNWNARACIGFRRLGPPQRGGYQSVTRGTMCAPRAKPFGSNDVAIFIESVRPRR